MPSDNRQTKLERRERLPWRAFPCSECSGGRSPCDFLRESLDSGKVGFGTQLDQQIEIEARLLVEWAKSCPHAATGFLDPPLLAEGSEHAVYLQAEIGEVYKITLPGIFGDWYFLENGFVRQTKCTPTLYLFRLELWADLFGSTQTEPEGAAPIPIGVTPTGQIVTRQKFIETSPPTQQQVDDGLETDGWIPLKKNCWLWRKPINEEYEVRLGDARDENFALRQGRLIPIDIRLWLVKRSAD
ncbi:MAG: hypothetical protein LV480_03000 [Methylacidiphilales bacterium]|nr:hypothetical protein [Candidatus Methylacidiphilales bacterium]